MNISRIKELREARNLKQEQVAQYLGIERPAYSQRESGDRKFQVDEIMKLADLFEISCDELLGRSVLPEVILERESSTNGGEKPSQIRIEVPQKNLRKFREVLLYILNKVGAKPNVGKTVLYKLLYFIDFNYYELYEEQCIGATYYKNPHGPTPLEFQEIVKEMAENGDLEMVTSKRFQYDQKKYLPLRPCNRAELTGRDLEVIDKVLDALSDMTAHQISAYSHGDIPWIATENGKEIPYESVFYRTPAYSMREYIHDEDE